MLAILCLLFTSVNIIASQETDLTNINNVASQIPKQASSYIAQANIDYALLDEIDKQVLVLMGKGDLLSARQLINQSIDATDFSRSPRSLVNRLLIRATLDRDVGANISALQDLQFAFRLSASTSQQDLVADVAYTIASIHQSRNEHSIALSYVQQALDKYKKQGADNKVTSSMLLAISSLLATNQVELAFDYLDETEPYIGKFGNLQQKARYFQYLGEAQLNSRNYIKSIETLTIATKLVPAHNPSQLATLYLLLSRAHTSMDHMDIAIEHLIKAFSIVDNTASSSFYLNQALQLHRANLLGQLNQFEAAFKVTQNVLKDRELNQPVAEIKRMLDMHANFQLELQQQENADLKQENQWKSTQIENKQMLNRLYFLVIGLLVCISSLLLLFYLRGRKHRKNLEKITHTDALTGLHSRMRVLSLLSHHQDLYSRNLQPFCVAIIDLDLFKNINDNYGHLVGDKVLRAFGDICKANFRKSDISGRIGGEEFLIILPHTNITEAVDVFNQFKQKLPAIGEELGLTLTTTASIGTVSPLADEAPMDIIRRADIALYKAKAQGRNCVVIGNN
ncbi:MAG: diguanylate cyclase (GGDEF)-like protein [Alphaproteobacteria bacterium]|jgi:diguanylate cyclase (GGDEF)-like protein